MSSARDALVMMEIGGEVAAAPLEGQLGGAPANLNISDVIEAISLADPSFGAAGVEGEMYRVSPPSAPPPTASLTAPADRPRAPTVRILEQPAGKALRFRYECEGRSAGSIPGVNSTSERKTYPTIEISGYKGNAIVVVSCVNKDPENKKYRPHPHNLVGRERCKNGVCTVEVSGENPVVTFSNLGIQCVKRRDIGEALRLREEIRVDPYKTGFGHKSQPQSIELNAVRLCFQVFLRERSGKITAALPPVVSDVIYDKKAMSDLNIARVSHCTGPATGGTEIILLCEKVNREDIALVFFETSADGRVVWEETANVLLVYKQVAIVAESPPYRDPNTNQHHQVQIQLKRLVDDTRSPPCSFMYIPNYKDPNSKKRKTISPYVETLYDQDRSFHVDKKEIKVEPKSDKTPPHHVSSPPQAFPQYQDINYQRWAMQIENMQQGLPLGPGPSSMNPFMPQDIPWTGPEYGQPTSPNMQTLSPNMQGAVSPNMHSVSPNMQVMSPNMQPTSPNMQPRSPHMQPRSPNMQPMSSNMQMMSPMQVMSPHMPAVSPNYTAMSPEIQTLPSGMKMANLQTMNPMSSIASNMQTLPSSMKMANLQTMNPMPSIASNMHNLAPMPQGMLQGGLSPNHNMGHVSPNMVEVSANALRTNVTQMQQHNAMETLNNDSPSFSGLLDDRGEMAQLNSSEISGLVAMLENPGDLSDSLNRLSTREPY